MPKDPLYYSENEKFKDSDRRLSEWLSLGQKNANFHHTKWDVVSPKARWSSWDIGNFDPNINVPPRRKIKRVGMRKAYLNSLLTE